MVLSRAVLYCIEMFCTSYFLHRLYLSFSCGIDEERLLFFRRKLLWTLFCQSFHISNFFHFWNILLYVPLCLFIFSTSSTNTSAIFLLLFHVRSINRFLVIYFLHHLRTGGLMTGSQLCTVQSTRSAYLISL